jgi:hypothetical protein
VRMELVDDDNFERPVTPDSSPEEPEVEVLE